MLEKAKPGGAQVRALGPTEAREWGEKHEQIESKSQHTRAPPSAPRLTSQTLQHFASPLGTPVSSSIKRG